MVPFFVSLEDVFEAAEHSLEAVSVDGGDSDSIDCFHAGLPVDIMQKSELSEVVTLLVLIDNSRELVLGFLLFSNKVAFKDDVELVSAFALLDDVLSIFEFFFFQDVVKLLSKIIGRSTFRES